jgi:hypothetical protein
MKNNIPSSLKDSLQRSITELSDSELEVGIIEAKSSDDSLEGRALERAIADKIHARRNRFANGSTHLPAEAWGRVRQAADTECNRILSGHTSEVLGIDALRGQAADLLNQADAKQAEFSRMDRELKQLPGQIQKIAEQLAQIGSQRSVLDKKRLEDQFENTYLRSVVSPDIGQNLRATQDAGLLAGVLATLPLRLKALDKIEDQLQAELVKLTDKQSDLEAKLR